MPGGSVPTLLNRVVSPNPRVSWDAAIALKGLGRAAAVAVPVLTGLLGGETAHVRASAAYVLGEVGAENRDTVSALIGALGDENVDVRRLAAEALGQLGLEARAAVRALIRTLRDEHMIVAGYAAWALKQIGVAPGDCIRIEVHDKYGLAKHSFACLQDQLEPLEGFVSSLIEALHDDESAVRAMAADVLGETEAPAVEKAVPALREALEDDSREVRRSAAWAVASIGRAPESLAPTLAEALRKQATSDEDNEARRAAIAALRVVAPWVPRPTVRMRVYLSVDPSGILFYPTTTTPDGRDQAGGNTMFYLSCSETYAGWSYDELAALGDGFHDIELEADAHFLAEDGA